jgi:hypothetical protein
MPNHPSETPSEAMQEASITAQPLGAEEEKEKRRSNYIPIPLSATARPMDAVPEALGAVKDVNKSESAHNATGINASIVTPYAQEDVQQDVATTAKPLAAPGEDVPWEVTWDVPHGQAHQETAVTATTSSKGFFNWLKKTLKTLNDKIFHLKKPYDVLRDLQVDVQSEAAEIDKAYKQATNDAKHESKTAHKLEQKFQDAQAAEAAAELKLEKTAKIADKAHVAVVDSAVESYNKTVSDMYYLQKGIGLREPFPYQGEPEYYGQYSESSSMRMSPLSTLASIYLIFAM